MVLVLTFSMLVSLHLQLAHVAFGLLRSHASAIEVGKTEIAVEYRKRIERQPEVYEKVRARVAEHLAKKKESS